MPAIMEILFGDLWKKQRSSTIVGIVTASLVSVAITATIASLLDWAYSYKLTVTGIAEGVMGQRWESSIVYTFFGIACVFLIWHYSVEHVTLGLVPSILQMAHKDVFDSSNKNYYDSILPKNFVLTVCRYTLGLRGILVGLTNAIVLIVYLPAIFTGVICYVVVVVLVHANASSLLSSIRSVPQLQDVGIVLTTISQLWPTLASIELRPALMIISLVVAVFFLSTFSDLITCREEQQLRGTPTDVLRRSTGRMIVSFNLPSKFGRFVYLVASALVTDRRNLSVNIPVISEKKLLESLQEIIGENGQKECVTLKLPLLFDANEVINMIESMPQEMRTQLIASVRNTSSTSAVIKIIKLIRALPGGRSLFHKVISSIRTNAEKSGKQISKARKLFLLCGVARDGVCAYAILEHPPPTHRTLIVRTLWCSEYLLKEPLIKAFEYR